MTPEQFAKDAGCVVSVLDDPRGWGGKYAYTSAEYKHSKICGFRTEAAAYKAFLIDTFGERPAKALIKLLKKTDAPAQPAQLKPLTTEQIMDVTRKAGNELLDFIYEYGTVSEGIDQRVVKIARAIEAAHGIKGDA